jgi:aminomethyltransferase
VAELKKTALNDAHIQLGAKMVDFAGFFMPVQYEGILKEHEHTRSKASIFDISHMGEFRLKGKNAREELSRIVTHNLEKLGPGRCSYGFLLNDSGGILDDLIIYCLAYDEYMLVVNAACIDQDYTRIFDMLPEHFFFENISELTSKIDLQGPLSCKALNRVMGRELNDLTYFGCQKDEFEGDPIIISRTGYTGELGYELYTRNERIESLWERLLEDPEVKPAGLGARDTLRLEAGLPLYGSDMDESRTPAEVGYGMLLKSKAEYAGKDGAQRVKEKLIPLAIEGRRSAAQDDPVLLPSGETVGRVTSASFAPSLGHAIALAYVLAEHAQAEHFQIQGKRAVLEAARVELPFYKNGSARMKTV